MPTSSKALIAWSSGKDSAWALHETRVAGCFEIVGALTTVTDTFRRVSMHGVREELLRAQLDAAGLKAVQKVAKQGTDNAFGQGDGHPKVAVTLDTVTTG